MSWQQRMRRLTKIEERHSAPEKKAREAQELAASMERYVEAMWNDHTTWQPPTSAERLAQLNGIRSFAFDLPPLATLPWLSAA